MNREEIEKLIEETARKERSKRKGVSVQKVRSILAVIGAGMCFKIIEFFLRFLF